MTDRSEQIDLAFTLVLVPTEKERDFIAEPLVERCSNSEQCEVALCGFGPIAAGIQTARKLNGSKFKRVLLLGIAGTYDSSHLPVGSAATFSKVGCYGIGAGQGLDFRTPSEMGLPQFQQVMPGGEPCFEELPLDDRSQTSSRKLLTVCSAANSQEEIQQRRRKFPDAIAEDMEGFSVALAAASFGIPTTVIRGISNIAGDRDHKNWKVEIALGCVMDLLLSEPTD